MNEKSIIERAFELADSGQLQTMEQLSRQLVREGYEAVHLHLSGRSTLRKQLLAKCRRPQDAKTDQSMPA